MLNRLFKKKKKKQGKSGSKTFKIYRAYNETVKRNRRGGALTLPDT